MRRSVLALAAVVILLTGSVAVAHHSYADFDQDRTVSIEGTVEKVLFSNPHVVLTVRTRDAAAYTVTWNAANQLNRQGVPASQLKVGDTVVVSGSPSKVAAELSRISEVRRPSDGWAWRMQDGRVSVTAAR
jgi:hypothetical protein